MAYFLGNIGSKYDAKLVNDAEMLEDGTIMKPVRLIRT